MNVHGIYSSKYINCKTAQILYLLNEQNIKNDDFKHNPFRHKLGFMYINSFDSHI